MTLAKSVLAIRQTWQARDLPPLLPLLVVGLLVFCAIFAPLLAPHSPIEGALGKRLIPPLGMEASSGEHVLGTDRLGRDTLSRLIYGVQISLAVVKYVSQQIGVMYLGKLVETAASAELYAHPLHPYTQVLLSNALPAHPNNVHEEVILPGEVPSPFNPPSGCRFHPGVPRLCPCARRSSHPCASPPLDMA
jgi:oligopeptide/dipeptide ABC transporter ATP-binding protein